MSSLVLDGLAVDGPQGRIIHETSVRLVPGVPLALIGETGSGKSLLLQAIMGTLPPGLAAVGSVRLDGTELLRLGPGERRALWGRRMAMLPQEPWAALNPLMQAATQVAEVPRFLARLPWTAARRRAGEELNRLGLDPFERRFPFRLSGGMGQRVALAATRIAGAPVLLADEPTKGLDAALRDDVAALLKAEAASGRIVLAVTHDLAVAQALGGEVVVMLSGRIVERGAAAEVLAAPGHAYTRRLVGSAPSLWLPWPRAAPAATLIEARGVAKGFGRQRLFEGLDLILREQGRLALTGPSGSGKSTLGNVLLGLLPPDAGTVTRRSGLAAPRLQKLYQEPLAAFAPRMTLGAAIAAVIARLRLDPALPARWLPRLRLDPQLLGRRPDQVSGGELQRVALMRAMLPGPRVLFADEPTSRLDPVTQQEVMEALRDALAETDAALLLVTHEPAIAAAVADQRLALAGAGRR